MNCANHPESTAVAYCRVCGKALCEECQRPAGGTVYCEEHAISTGAAASSATYSPYSTPYTPPVAPGTPSPGLAFLLGLIPGVGAIYNAQYAKGLIHVLILGLLISITNSGAAEGMEPLFGLLIPLWFFYMAFEAYHTALKRQRGEPVDEFSSIFPLQRGGASSLMGPIVLIVVGGVLLLNTLEIIRLYQVLRFWPIFLIFLGAYMLYIRVRGGNSEPLSQSEVRNEQ